MWSINGKTPGDDEERDLTYYGWSLVDDISPDGRTFVFTEGGEADPQNNWSVFLRGMDGSPSQRLGQGYGGKLSPDGNWVAAIMPDKKDEGLQVTVTPNGPGEPRQLTNAKDQKYQVVGWLPDSPGASTLSTSRRAKPSRGKSSAGSCPGQGWRPWALFKPVPTVEATYTTTRTPSQPSILPTACGNVTARELVTGGIGDRISIPQFLWINW